MPATQRKCIYWGLTLVVDRHYIGSVTATTHQEKGPFSNIIEYQKYIVTSIKEGCATRSLYDPKAEGVPTNNQSGRGSGPCRLWRGLDKARHIVPTALLVRVQCFRNDLHKAVKRPSTRPIVLSMIVGTYWRRRRRLTIFEPDEMKFASPLTLFILKTRSPKKTGWVIPLDTYSWNDVAPNLDRISEYDLKNFPKGFRSLDICSPVSIVLK